MSIPTYYNNFKKQEYYNEYEQNEPEEVMDIKKLFGLALFGATVTTGAAAKHMGQQPAQPNVAKFQVARQKIMKAGMLAGSDLKMTKDYISVLEKQIYKMEKEKQKEMDSEVREWQEKAEKSRKKAEEADKKAKKAKQGEAYSDAASIFFALLGA